MTDRDERNELQRRALEDTFNAPPLSDRQKQQVERLNQALHDETLSDGDRQAKIYQILTEED